MAAVALLCLAGRMGKVKKNSAAEVSQSFVGQLIGDVIAAEERLVGEDLQRHRRDVVRTRFAAIEGLV